MRDDLFDTLRTLPPAGDPLPPAEIRRRGDRLRRRRTTLQVVGAALVVAVIAGGAVTVADRIGAGGSEPPPIAPSRTVDQVPRIPDAFPLTDGWAAPTADGTRQGPSRSLNPLYFVRCDVEFRPPAGGDRLTAWQTEGSAGWERQLDTFGTEDRARQALAELRDRFGGCSHWFDEGIVEFRSELRSLAGHDGFQVVQWMVGGASASAYTVVQRGRAVLVAAASTEGSGKARAEQAAASELDELAGPISALCEFTSAGCGAPEEEPSHPSLAAFPLETGWPQEGDLSDDASLRDVEAPLELELCGVETWTLPEPIGLRGRALSAADSGGTRQVLLYDTEATAAAVLDDAQRQVCAEGSLGDGSTRRGASTRSDEGGTDWLTVLQWAPNSGQATQLVRHGRVVLVSTWGGLHNGERSGAEEFAAEEARSLEPAITALLELG